MIARPDPMASPNWDDDKLQRSLSADFLTKYLAGHFASREQHSGNGFVLNINAPWGFGKTFFLERWAEDLKGKGYPVVFFNAWENDYSVEPLAVFLNDVDSQLSPFLNRSSKAKEKLARTKAAAKGLLKPSVPLLLSILAKRLTGESLEDAEAILDIDLPTSETSEAVAGLVSSAAEQMMEESKKTKRAIKDFRDNLGLLIKQMQGMKSVKLPLFIFVDELDRCRPDFSIKFLEIAKHLFGVQGVYFVVSTDSSQLGASIKAVYGESFDSHRYLHRFFSQEFSLPEPAHKDFAEFLFTKLPDSLHAKLFCPLDTEVYVESTQAFIQFALFSKYFKLSLREQIRAYELLEAVVTSYGGKLIYTPWLLYLIMIRIRWPAIFAIIKEGSFNISEIHKQVSDSEIDGSTRYCYRDGKGRAADHRISSLVVLLANYIHKSLGDIANQTASSESAERKLIEYFRAVTPQSWNSINPPQHDLKEYPDMVAQAGYLHSIE